jgi:hypothetical protein
MILLVECIGFVWFVWEECIFSNREESMFSFVGPCRPYIPCNSQDDFHRRGHIGHWSIFLFGGIGLSSGLLRIWLILVWDGNNFRCNHVFDSLLIEQYLFCVWVVRILFCTIVHILHWICPCYLGQDSVLQKTWRLIASSVLFNIPDDYDCVPYCWQWVTRYRPDLSSDRAPHRDKTANFRQN